MDTFEYSSRIRGSKRERKREGEKREFSQGGVTFSPFERKEREEGEGKNKENRVYRSLLRRRSV